MQHFRSRGRAEAAPGRTEPLRLSAVARVELKHCHVLLGACVWCSLAAPECCVRGGVVGLPRSLLRSSAYHLYVRYRLPSILSMLFGVKGRSAGLNDGSWHSGHRLRTASSSLLSHSLTLRTIPRIGALRGARRNDSRDSRPASGPCSSRCFCCLLSRRAGTSKGSASALHTPLSKYFT